MFQAAFPILTAVDMAHALGFYRDLLGYTVTYRFPAGGEPAYVGLPLGQSALGIGVAEPAVQHECAETEDRSAMCVYEKDCDCRDRAPAGKRSGDPVRAGRPALGREDGRGSGPGRQPGRHSVAIVMRRPE